MLLPPFFIFDLLKITKREQWLCLGSLALTRHTSVPVSLIKHRSSYLPSAHLVLMSFIAYGEYNNLVLDAAGIRGQAAVIWDLEYVFFASPGPKCVIFMVPFHSSGDSAGASVASQKSEYDDAVDRHPSTILSLQHEVYGALHFPLIRYI